MQLDEFLLRLKTMGKRINSSTVKALYQRESFILRELRAHSPKDTKTFASNWRARRVHFSGVRSMLGGLVITNKTAEYGRYLETGAEPGEHPWYFPHKHKKKTGKLKEVGGKVWAGGLRPGHHMTVGGPITKLIKDTKLLNMLTKDISDAAIKVAL